MANHQVSLTIKQALCTTLLLPLLAIPALPVLAVEDGRITAMVAKGDNLCRDKKFGEAESLAKEALTLNPSSTAAMMLLSKAYRNLGKSVLSHSWLEQALKLEPKNYLIHLEFARYFNSYNKYDQAMQAVRRAMTLAPQTAECYFVLGWIQKNTGDKEAESSLRRAIKLDPNKAFYHRLLGMLLEEQKRFKEAMVENQTAIKLEPTRERLVSSVGALLITEGKLKEGKAYYLKMARDFPKSVEPYLNLAKIAQLEKDPKLAEALLKKATIVSPSNFRSWLQLAQFLSTQRKLDEALKTARVAYNFNSNSDEAASTLAMALWDKDNPREAEVYMAHSVQMAKSAESRLLHQNLLSRLKFINGKPDQGMELAKQSYRQAPRNPSAVASMAWALMCFRKYDEGLAMLRTARIQHPDDRNLQTDYLEGLCGAKKYEQARAFGREMIAKNPDDRTAWLCLLAVANKTKNKADMAEALKHVSLSALSAQESMEVGFSGLEVGMDKQSFPALKKALETNPDNAELLLNTRDPRK